MSAFVSEASGDESESDLGSKFPGEYPATEDYEDPSGMEDPRRGTRISFSPY